MADEQEKNVEQLPEGGAARPRKRGRTGALLAGAAALVALLALGVAFYVGQRRGGGADEVSQYVPREALAFVRIDDLAGLADRFPQSPLGRFLAKGNVRDMLADFDADAGVAEAYGRVQDDLTTLVRNPGFRALFGDDLSAALLPPDAGRLATEPEAALRDAVLVYATTRAAPFAELFGGIAPGVKIDKQEVEGVKFSRIRAEGAADMYAYGAGGVLTLAWDPAPLLAAARARQSGANLGEQAGFQEARAFWQSAPAGLVSRGYADIAALRVWLADRLAPALADADTAGAVRDAAAWYAGMDYAYDATAVGAGGIEHKGRLRCRREALHPMFREMLDGETAGGAPFAPFALLNDDTLWFDWGSALRPESLLAMIAEGEPEQYAELQKAAHLGLGMEIEEAAAAFGPRYALVLNDIAATGLIPVPDLTLLTNVRDRGRVERLAGLANRSLAAYGLGETPPRQAGATLLYAWPLLREAGLAPTLGIDDRRAFLGVMQRSVDALLAENAESGAAQPLPEGLRALLGPDLAARFARAGGGFLLRPAKLADKCRPLVALLSGITGKATALERELDALMRSGEALVGITNWGPEHWDWEAAWIPAATPGNPPNPAPAGQKQ